MKLNLGCGPDIRKDYINVDISSNIKGVKIVDLNSTPWPWPWESVEEILMLDILEHFSHRKTRDTLFEVWRVLKQDGFVDIQVPDFEQCSLALNMQTGMICNRCGYQFSEEDSNVNKKCGRCSQNIFVIAEEGMRRLYGGQNYDGNWHNAAFTKKTLIHLLENIGFDCSFLEVHHQKLNWNFKVRAVKKESVW